jgi:hypothetical protein
VKRTHRNPTKAELATITSSRPVLRREPVTEAQKGPVVRAAWLASQYDAGTEERVAGDAPGALAFGSANVSDVPLSMQWEGQPTAVIPQNAIAKHNDKNNKGGRG